MNLNCECGKPFGLGGGGLRVYLLDPKYPRRSRQAYELHRDDHPSQYRTWVESDDYAVFERLPEDERNVYLAKAKEDRSRYELELSNYKPSSGWIDRRTGRHKTINDWHAGYLPKRGIFRGVVDTQSSQKKHRVAKSVGDKEAQFSWTDLNSEVVSVIGSFFEHPRDAFSMCYTCSNWKKALSDRESVAQEAVWRPLVMSRFPHLFQKERLSDRRCHEFVLKDSRFTYRDVFILHDRITCLDHDAELAKSDEHNRIDLEGIEEKDFVVTYVLTHYSTGRQLATRYSFGMGTLEEMEHRCYLPNFHDMILSTDYDTCSELNERPCRDRSTIPVLRCFVTGPGYDTIMIFKFTNFDAEWGREGYKYGACHRDEGNEALSELWVSGGAIEDYMKDDLRFDIESDEDGLLSALAEFF